MRRETDSAKRQRTHKNADRNFNQKPCAAEARRGAPRGARHAACAAVAHRTPRGSLCRHALPDSFACFCTLHAAE